MQKLRAAEQQKADQREYDKRRAERSITTETKRLNDLQAANAAAREGQREARRWRCRVWSTTCGSTAI
ncbi:hypothetical protein [Frigoriglobus tundricola]|uniref:Uncharacterized protein n=1 Tax=Frigoriglobus tundricola TaxID=2774151 RepID=A0A6M5YUI6_9BACT|nr:hypothetical protein [Frigoriglobus tundricola]QJW97757.1 hypothetical protein FTUN_5335 [Frigoriglobus tundricola]